MTNTTASRPRLRAALVGAGLMFTGLSLGGCDVETVGDSLDEIELRAEEQKFDVGPLDEELIATRVEQLDGWAAEHDYAAPLVSEDRHEVYAPEGQSLVFEIVGGRTIVYSLPTEFVDGETHEVLQQAELPELPSGPFPSWAASAQNQGQCDCADEGTCGWSNGACVPNPSCNCSTEPEKPGDCRVTVSGPGFWSLLYYLVFGVGSYPGM